VILIILWAALGVGSMGVGLLTFGFCWRTAQPPSEANGFVVALAMVASLALTFFGLALFAAALATAITPEVTL
jgi:hypothetical protein